MAKTGNDASDSSIAAHDDAGTAASRHFNLDAWSQSSQHDARPQSGEHPPSLPHVEVAGGGGGNGGKQDSGGVMHWLSGVGRVAGAVADGVGHSAASALHTAAGAAVDVYEHRADIAHAVADAGRATAGFAAEAVQHPGEALRQAGDAAASGAQAALHGGERAAQWVGDHPLEAGAVTAAVVLEVGSAGTASPLAAAVATAAGILVVHSAASLGEALHNDGQQVSVLMNPDGHSQAEVDAARQKVAADTGGAVLG